jgi:thioredoxin reductase
MKNFVILERRDIGASFGNWPEEMNFITPSFPAHGFGLLDLNAVVPDTSPGHILKQEHPDGKSYQICLKSVAKHFELPVVTGINVLRVEPLLPGKGFKIFTDRGVLASRFVVWAAGEFQYPNHNSFPGSEYCIHNSNVESWRRIKGDEIIVIGGFESGLDAAINLISLGKTVHLFDREEAWKGENPDPSCSLSPYTVRRLMEALKSGRLHLNANTAIKKVEREPNGYSVTNGVNRFHTMSTPILATGFKTSLTLVSELFEWKDKENYPMLNEHDESTITPGLFLIGPNVRHDDLIFCFIYKFRQRFAVVAKEISSRLRKRKTDTSVLDFYREKGMFLDDMSCCGNDCRC